MSFDAPARSPHVSPLVFALVGCVLAAFPFLAVDYVPATDLPQHAAQIRLLRELWGLAALTVDTSQLVARPFGANTLCYWPMLALSEVCSARDAARLSLLFWIESAVVSLHALAWRRGRPPAHALLAGMLLFGLPLYWGLLNFVCGIAPFVWLCERALVERSAARTRTKTDLAIDASLLLVLYLAHVLWLAAAAAIVCVVAVRGVVKQHNFRDAGLWLMCFAPLALVVARWLPELSQGRAASGMDIAALYVAPLSARLSIGWFVNTLFGGLQGPFEPLALVALVVYAAGVLALSRRALDAKFDRAVLAIGVGIALFALFAPDRYLNTILFNERFLGCGVMFVLLSLPAVSRRALSAFALVAAFGFSLVTTAAWIVFDEDELTGYTESLASLGQPQRLLELDYRKYSEVVRGRPFFQLVAYAQAERGGELAFSFAEHQSSIVAFRSARRVPWTLGLEWYPEQAQARDVSAFDCVLVNGTPEQHQEFTARFGLGLSAQREHGYFRLYCRDPQRGK